MSKLICYTDGSYDTETGRFGYGLVLISENGEVSTFEEAFADEDFSKSQSVAGEVFGAIKAFHFAKKMGYSELELCHDYIGIACWAKGDWRAKTPIAKYYVSEYLRAIEDGMEIVFKKVKAHSGDEYNDLADYHARCALGKE